VGFLHAHVCRGLYFSDVYRPLIAIWDDEAVACGGRDGDEAGATDEQLQVLDGAQMPGVRARGGAPRP
jgi:hypothetical protein